MKRFIIFLCFVLASLVGCQKVGRDYFDRYQAEIKQYMESEKLSGFTFDERGFYYKITKASTQPANRPLEKSYLLVNYQGWLMNQAQFIDAKKLGFYLDEQYDNNQSLPIKVLQLFLPDSDAKEGDWVDIITQPHLAYGSDAYYKVPANSPIRLRIQILEIR